MICNFEKEIESNFDFDEEKVYRNVVETILDKYNCPYECEVSLILVDDDTIKEINKETREIEAVTDVLSFPNVDFSDSLAFDDIDENGDYFEPDSGELILGDIILNYNRVVSQAKEYGHSELREYAFLITHSMLHLLGFDHIEDDDRVIMEEKQREIMELLNIKRD